MNVLNQMAMVDFAEDNMDDTATVFDSAALSKLVGLVAENFNVSPAYAEKVIKSEVCRFAAEALDMEVTA